MQGELGGYAFALSSAILSLDLLRAISLALLIAGVSFAHDIPPQATVRLLIEPAERQLAVAIRVPLASMRDVEFPETETGYLDLEGLEPKLADLATTWLLPFLGISEGGQRLPAPRIAATQISLPSDKSFAAMESARARLAAPPPSNSENLVAEQVYFDVLLEFPIDDESSAFAMRPRLDHLADRVLTVLLYYAPGGGVRAYQFDGDPGPVELDPGWSQAASRFVWLGFDHILGGLDHLLFLFCLVIPFRKLRPLVWIVTAFTLAHSLTLAASALELAPDGLWFPPLVETLIAGSILWMALENIVFPPTLRRRWIFAFAFGLVHGFGFSFALRESLQFAGSHLWASLIAFNVGVELGQILVLLGLLAVLAIFFRYAVSERTGIVVLSAVGAHSAWHWTADRWVALQAYELSSTVLLVAAGAAVTLLGAAAWRSSRTNPA